MFGTTIPFFCAPGFLGLALNGKLLTSFWKDRKKLQPPEFFLVNLCIADLITIIFAYPLAIVSFYSHAWIWGHAGNHFCCCC